MQKSTQELTLEAGMPVWDTVGEDWLVVVDTTELTADEYICHYTLECEPVTVEEYNKNDEREVPVSSDTPVVEATYFSDVTREYGIEKVLSSQDTMHELTEEGLAYLYPFPTSRLKRFEQVDDSVETPGSVKKFKQQRDKGRR